MNQHTSVLAHKGSPEPHLNRFQGLYQRLTMILSLRGICLTGSVGTLLIVWSSFGVGATPTKHNVFQFIPTANLISRMPTTGISMSYLGGFLLLLAWLALVFKYRYSINLTIADKKRLFPVKFLLGMFVVWLTPMVFSVPMYSQDIYSYFAQGSMLKHHYDPYALGPENSLGPDDLYSSSVPAIWWYNPSPYGPLFLWWAKIVVHIMNGNFLIGVIIFRILAIASIAVIVIYGLKICRLYNANENSFCIYGLLNPLIGCAGLLPLHNDIVAGAAMVAGIYYFLIAERSLRNITSFSALRPAVLSLGYSFLMASVGTVLITCGALIKVPVICALPFLGLYLALHIYYIAKLGLRTLRLSSLIQNITSFLIPAILLIYIVLLSVGICSFFGTITRLGFGWINVLLASDTDSITRIHPILKFINSIGSSLSLGNHLNTLSIFTSSLPKIGFLLLFIYLLRLVFKRDIYVVEGITYILVYFSIFIPSATNPWYFLWWVPLIAIFPNKKLPFFFLMLGTIVMHIDHPGGHPIPTRQVLYACLISGIPLIIYCVWKIFPRKIAPHTEVLK